MQKCCIWNELVQIFVFCYLLCGLPFHSFNIPHRLHTRTHTYTHARTPFTSHPCTLHSQKTWPGSVRSDRVSGPTLERLEQTRGTSLSLMYLWCVHVGTVMPFAANYYKLPVSGHHMLSPSPLSLSFSYHLSPSSQQLSKFCPGQIRWAHRCIPQVCMAVVKWHNYLLIVG